MRGRELGDGLRKVITRSGFSGRKLATLLGWDHAKLVDLLNGRIGVTEIELASLLGACHVPADERDHLLALYREADVRGWWQQHGSRLPINLRTLIEHENAATEIINWQTTLIPGLLQTPGYLRAIMGTLPNTPADEIEERVQARLARQVILERDTRCTFYLQEQVLLLPVGGTEVLSEQLHHLLRMSVRPSVDLRIVPTAVGQHYGLNGSFVLMKFDGIGPVVHVENHTSSLFIEDKEPIQTYLSIVKALDAVALDAGESRRLITGIIG